MRIYMYKYVQHRIGYTYEKKVGTGLESGELEGDGSEEGEGIGNSFGIIGWG